MKKVSCITFFESLVTCHLSLIFVIPQTITPFIDPFTKIDSVLSRFLKPDIERFRRFEINILSFHLETR